MILKGSLIWKESDLIIVDDIINEAKIMCKAYKRAIFIKQVVSKGSGNSINKFIQGV